MFLSSRQVDELNETMTELRQSQRVETNRSESTESGIRSPEIGSEEAALLKVLYSSVSLTRGTLVALCSSRIFLLAKCAVSVIWNRLISSVSF